MEVVRLQPSAILPSRGSPDAAGFDLYSADHYVVFPGQRVVVSTGIGLKGLPPSTYGRIAPRSGLAVKHGLDVLAGVVDPDYRGEIKVVLLNTDMRIPFVIKPGYRIAQFIVENYTVCDISETFDENETARGTSGFGSTGV